ncbi:hypothetical protein ACRQ1B_12040 [Rhizobium panacihumi]|uniref:hypothetical protein n=1 Tax=Rhizobium panacihumi TaxID=2008450 RepID=UPI003D7A0C4E
MLDGMLQSAHFQAEPSDDRLEGDTPPITEALDALLTDLMSQCPDFTVPALADATTDNNPDENGAGQDIPAVLGEPDRPMPAEPETASEPMPTRVYSIGDLMLFERLTGYRLVAQRQLWRSVDKEGNRSMAGDRLFTVLAEEAFQLADRQRRNGPSPQADLTVQDIAIALKPMRAIAAHLGERGIQACDRMEAIVTATLDRRNAA